MNLAELARTDRLAALDRVHEDQREIMLAVHELPGFAERIAEAARVPVACIKAAATVFLGIKPDANGDGERCTKHADQFIGMSPKTLEEHGCLRCTLEPEKEVTL